jgi:hypothetical protein
MWSACKCIEWSHCHRVQLPCKKSAATKAKRVRADGLIKAYLRIALSNTTNHNLDCVNQKKLKYTNLINVGKCQYVNYCHSFVSLLLQRKKKIILLYIMNVIFKKLLVL